MTKLEEQELYYDNILDKIIAMDESTQLSYLSKLDEATSDKVMERMIRRTNKTLSKMQNKLRKDRDVVAKNSEPAKAEAKASFMKHSNIVLREIETFQNTYIKAWNELVSKAKSDVLGTSDASQITANDLKQYKKDGIAMSKDGVTQ